jgi:hypothetical protein
MWLAFTDQRLSSLVVGWEETARELVAQFRAAAGRHPDDPRYAELVSALRQVNPRFGTWWDEYPVAGFDSGLRRFRHPVAGHLELDSVHLQVETHPGLTLVLHTPVSSEDAARLRDLMGAERSP